MSIRFVLAGVCILGLAACATPRPEHAVESVPAYHTLAAEKYGDTAEVVMNEGGTYALVRVQAPFDAADPLPKVRFFVYDLAAEAVTVEAEVTGEVGWADAYHLGVYGTPGIVQENAPPAGYRLDVRTGARRPLGR